MKQTILHCTLIGLTAITISGCTPQAPQSTSGGAVPPTANKDEHAHQSKYNEVLVEFPGHKYAMEIIDEKETTGLVTAFLTDAHFEPIAVDAQEVKLNFLVKGAPKTYTLTRSQQQAGKPATFTLTDMELATMNCEGWEGDATASVKIDGTPYNSKLIKLGHHDHGDHERHDNNKDHKDHEDHGHAH